MRPRIDEVTIQISYSNEMLGRNLQSFSSGGGKKKNFIKLALWKVATRKKNSKGERFLNSVLIYFDLLATNREHDN